MDQLINELKRLGLSDKEASVYLAALELGPSPVQDISHKSKVNRATTYVMIESLTARGLMSTFVKGKKRFYVAENPERLSSILDLKARELQERKTDLQKALPMLIALYNVEGAKPQVRYLEGVEGIDTVRHIFEKLEGEFVEIYPVKDVRETEEITRDQHKHHEALRLDKTLHRVLAVMDEADERLLPEMGNGEIRMVPVKDFPIHGSIVVRGNHVFLFSYRSTILAVVIISNEIANVVRALFELAWKGAQTFPGKKFE